MVNEISSDGRRRDAVERPQQRTEALTAAQSSELRSEQNNQIQRSRELADNRTTLINPATGERQTNTNSLTPVAQVTETEHETHTRRVTQVFGSGQRFRLENQGARLEVIRTGDTERFVAGRAQTTVMRADGNLIVTSSDPAHGEQQVSAVVDRRPGRAADGNQPYVVERFVRMHATGTRIDFDSNRDVPLRINDAPASDAARWQSAFSMIERVVEQMSTSLGVSMSMPTVNQFRDLLHAAEQARHEQSEDEGEDDEETESDSVVQLRQRILTDLNEQTVRDLMAAAPQLSQEAGTSLMAVLRERVNDRSLSDAERQMAIYGMGALARFATSDDMRTFGYMLSQGNNRDRTAASWAILQVAQGGAGLVMQREALRLFSAHGWSPEVDQSLMTSIWGRSAYTGLDPRGESSWLIRNPELAADAAAVLWRSAGYGPFGRWNPNNPISEAIWGHLVQSTASDPNLLNLLMQNPRFATSSSASPFLIAVANVGDAQRQRVIDTLTNAQRTNEGRNDEQSIARATAYGSIVANVIRETTTPEFINGIRERAARGDRAAIDLLLSVSLGNREQTPAQQRAHDSLFELAANPEIRRTILDALHAQPSGNFSNFNPELFSAILSREFTHSENISTTMERINTRWMPGVNEDARRWTMQALQRRVLQDEAQRLSITSASRTPAEAITQLGQSAATGDSRAVDALVWVGTGSDDSARQARQSLLSALSNSQTEGEALARVQEGLLQIARQGTNRQEIFNRVVELSSNNPHFIPMATALLTSREIPRAGNETINTLERSLQGGNHEAVTVLEIIARGSDAQAHAAMQLLMRESFAAPDGIARAQQLASQRALLRLGNTSPQMRERVFAEFERVVAHSIPSINPDHEGAAAAIAGSIPRRDPNFLAFATALATGATSPVRDAQLDVLGQAGAQGNALALRVLTMSAHGRAYDSPERVALRESISQAPALTIAQALGGEQHERLQQTMRSGILEGSTDVIARLRETLSREQNPERQQLLLNAISSISITTDNRRSLPASEANNLLQRARGEGADAAAARLTLISYGRVALQHLSAQNPADREIFARIVARESLADSFLSWDFSWRNHSNAILSNVPEAQRQELRTQLETAFVHALHNEVQSTQHQRAAGILAEVVSDTTRSGAFRDAAATALHNLAASNPQLHAVVTDALLRQAERTPNSPQLLTVLGRLPGQNYDHPATSRFIQNQISPIATPRNADIPAEVQQAQQRFASFNGPAAERAQILQQYFREVQAMVRRNGGTESISILPPQLLDSIASMNVEQQNLLFNSTPTLVRLATLPQSATREDVAILQVLSASRLIDNTLSEAQRNQMRSFVEGHMLAVISGATDRQVARDVYQAFNRSGWSTANNAQIRAAMTEFARTWIAAHPQDIELIQQAALLGQTEGPLPPGAWMRQLGINLEGSALERATATFGPQAITTFMRFNALSPAMRGLMLTAATNGTEWIPGSNETIAQLEGRLRTLPNAGAGANLTISDVIQVMSGDSNPNAELVGRIQNSRLNIPAVVGAMNTLIAQLQAENTRLEREIAVRMDGIAQAARTGNGFLRTQSTQFNEAQRLELRRIEQIHEQVRARNNVIAQYQAEVDNLTLSQTIVDYNTAVGAGNRREADRLAMTLLVQPNGMQYLHTHAPNIFRDLFPSGPEVSNQGILNRLHTDGQTPIPVPNLPLGTTRVWNQALESLRTSASANWGSGDAAIRPLMAQHIINGLQTDPRYQNSMRAATDIAQRFGELQRLFQIGANPDNARSPAFTASIRERAQALTTALNELRSNDYPQLLADIRSGLAGVPEGSPEWESLNNVRLYLERMETLDRQWQSPNSALRTMMTQIHSGSFDASTIGHWLATSGVDLLIEGAVIAGCIALTGGAGLAVRGVISAARAAAIMTVYMRAGNVAATEYGYLNGTRGNGHHLIDQFRSTPWTNSAISNDTFNQLRPRTLDEALTAEGYASAQTFGVNLAFMGAGAFLHGIAPLSTNPFSVSQIAENFGQNFRQNFVGNLQFSALQLPLEGTLVHVVGVNPHLAGHVSGAMVMGGHAGAQRIVRTPEGAFRFAQSASSEPLLQHTFRSNAEVVQGLRSEGNTVVRHNGQDYLIRSLGNEVTAAGSPPRPGVTTAEGTHITPITVPISAEAAAVLRASGIEVTQSGGQFFAREIPIRIEQVPAETFNPPSEPTQPTQPSRPSQPVQPAQPAQPSHHSHLANPAQPGRIEVRTRGNGLNAVEQNTGASSAALLDRMAANPGDSLHPNTRGAAQLRTRFEELIANGTLNAGQLQRLFDPAHVTPADRAMLEPLLTANGMTERGAANLLSLSREHISPLFDIPSAQFRQLRPAIERGLLDAQSLRRIGEMSAGNLRSELRVVSEFAERTAGGEGSISSQALNRYIQLPAELRASLNNYMTTTGGRALTRGEMDALLSYSSTNAAHTETLARQLRNGVVSVEQMRSVAAMGETASINFAEFVHGRSRQQVEQILRRANGDVAVLHDLMTIAQAPLTASYELLRNRYANDEPARRAINDLIRAHENGLIDGSRFETIRSALMEGARPNRLLLELERPINRSNTQYREQLNSTAARLPGEQLMPFERLRRRDESIAGIITGDRMSPQQIADMAAHIRQERARITGAEVTHLEFGRTQPRTGEHSEMAAVREFGEALAAGDYARARELAGAGSETERRFSITARDFNDPAVLQELHGRMDQLGSAGGRGLDSANIVRESTVPDVVVSVNGGAISLRNPRLVIDPLTGNRVREATGAERAQIEQLSRTPAGQSLLRHQAMVAFEENLIHGNQRVGGGEGVAIPLMTEFRNSPHYQRLQEEIRRQSGTNVARINEQLQEALREIDVAAALVSAGFSPASARELLRGNHEAGERAHFWNFLDAQPRPAVRQRPGDALTSRDHASTDAATPAIQPGNTDTVSVISRIESQIESLAAQRSHLLRQITELRRTVTSANQVVGNSALTALETQVTRVNEQIVNSLRQRLSAETQRRTVLEREARNRPGDSALQDQVRAAIERERRISIGIYMESGLTPPTLSMEHGSTFQITMPDGSRIPMAVAAGLQSPTIESVATVIDAARQVATEVHRTNAITPDLLRVFAVGDVRHEGGSHTPGNLIDQGRSRASGRIDLFIANRPGTSRGRIVDAGGISAAHNYNHEIGHSLMERYFNFLPTETRSAVLSTYRSALETSEFASVLRGSNWERLNGGVYFDHREAPIHYFLCLPEMFAEMHALYRLNRQITASQPATAQPPSYSELLQLRTARFNPDRHAFMNSAGFERLYHELSRRVFEPFDAGNTIAQPR